ncbi:meiotic cell cortex C-terminal pleckstrin homology-domain-containing protein [Chytriomyces sp. MP71]|nr:meiotic cell cortex C-terminal pleckstrin homology-domain-containing protein [Chytriomyces sp. MP71]
MEDNPTRDNSLHVDAHAHIAQLVEQLRQKEKDVQLAATIGQDLLAQVEALTRKVRMLETSSTASSIKSSRIPRPSTAASSSSSLTENSDTPKDVRGDARTQLTNRGNEQVPSSPSPVNAATLTSLAKSASSFSLLKVVASSVSSARRRATSSAALPLSPTVQQDDTSAASEHATPTALSISRSTSYLNAHNQQELISSNNQLNASSPITSPSQSTHRRQQQLDPNLALQIEHALVLQLRNLQSRSSVADQAKAELESKCDALSRELLLVRSQNERLTGAEAKLNERIWQLELTNQTHTTTHDSLQKDISRLTLKIKSLERECNQLKNVNDTLRIQEARVSEEREALQTRVDADAARRRRELSALKKEKAVLVARVEELLQRGAGFDGSNSTFGSSYHSFGDSRIGSHTGSSSSLDLTPPTASQLLNTATAGAPVSTNAVSNATQVDASHANLFIASLTSALDAAHGTNATLRGESQAMRENVADLERLLREANETIEALTRAGDGPDEDEWRHAEAHALFGGPGGGDMSLMFESSMMSLHDQIRMSSSMEDLAALGSLGWVEESRIEEHEKEALSLDDLMHAVEELGEATERKSGAVAVAAEEETAPMTEESSTTPQKPSLLEKGVSASTLMSPTPTPLVLSPAVVMVDFCGQTEGYGLLLHDPPTQRKQLESTSILHELENFDTFGGGGGTVGGPSAPFDDFSLVAGDMSLTSSRGTSIRSGIVDPNTNTNKSAFAQMNNGSFMYYNSAAERSRMVRHRSEVTFDHQTQEYVQYDATAIEALTATMVGTWFLKFNRHGKKPHLRFFWVDPYNRTLSWSSTATSTTSEQKSAKTVYIRSIKWTDPRTNSTNPTGSFDATPNWNKNYPPNSSHAIEIISTKRMVKMIPLNWADHRSWITGLSLLLSKSDTVLDAFASSNIPEDTLNDMEKELPRTPLHEHFKIFDGAMTLDRRPASRNSIIQMSPQRRSMTPCPQGANEGSRVSSRRREFSLQEAVFGSERFSRSEDVPAPMPELLLNHEGECVDGAGVPLPSWTVTVRSESPLAAGSTSTSPSPLEAAQPQPQPRFPAKFLKSSPSSSRIVSLSSNKTPSPSPPFAQGEGAESVAKGGIFSGRKGGNGTPRRRLSLMNFTPLRVKELKRDECE